MQFPALQNEEMATVKNIRDFIYGIEYKGKDSVFGHLKKYFWKYIMQVKIVLEVYIIPFFTVFTVFLPAYFTTNNKSNIKHSFFIEEAVHSLLVKECLTEVNDIPKCCNFLNVAGRNSKLRLVLDTSTSTST